RVARPGCSVGFARSCSRMSGEALTSAHWRSSRPLTIIEDWVLGRARKVRLRTPEQLRQLQFHWGKPPPAADPSTLILTIHRGWQEPRDQIGPDGSSSWPLYRRAMYSVISMPKRKSIA